MALTGLPEGLSARLVARYEKHLCAFEIVAERERDLEIPGSEVADGAHVASEPDFKLDYVQVDLEVHEQLRLRVRACHARPEADKIRALIYPL